MSHLTILRGYAQKANPASLPPSVLFSHTEKTITIFDAYPKSIFHFLILPRAGAFAPLSIFDLASLRTLLKRDKEKAREVITTLNDEAGKMRLEIEQEMLDRYGFKWDIWTGFHAVPSMEHIHLHVLSSDLCSPAMKNKKHYNSFHPTHGFFLDIDHVLSWFDAEPSFYKTMSELKKSQYEPLLKEGLCCFRCDRGLKNMPLLKAHLKDEWDKIAAQQKPKLVSHQKRKREAEDASPSIDHDTSHDAPLKRQDRSHTPENSETKTS